MTLSSLFRSALVGLTVLLVLAAPATAQTNELEQARLKGLTEFTILIEDLDDDDTRCGMSQGQLNAAATKALLDNGIRITDDGNVWLYVNPNTLYFDNTDGCVTNLDVELNEALFATPSHSLTPVYGLLELTSRSTILSSGRSDHGQRVRDSVFDYVEQIALAIRVANQ